MMKRIITYLLIWVAPFAMAQSVSSLQQQQKDLEKQIATTNKMLQQTQSNKKVTLNKLELLNQNIKTQRKWGNSLGNEIKALDRELFCSVLLNDRCHGGAPRAAAQNGYFARDCHCNGELRIDN